MSNEWKFVRKWPMKLNTTLAIMFHDILDLKWRVQCTPTTYLKWEQFALFAWKNKLFLFSKWLSPIIYETSGLLGAKHLFVRQWNNGWYSNPWNDHSWGQKICVFQVSSWKKLGMVGRNNNLFCQNILFSRWCQNWEAVRKTTWNIIDSMINTTTQLTDMRRI